MSEASKSSIGTLALRLAASLFLAGAAVFGVLATVVSRLPAAETGGYRLPGGAGTLDAAALIVLWVCSGVLATSAVGAFLFASAAPPVITRVPLDRGNTRSAMVLVVGLLALATVVAVRWLRF